MLSAIHIATRGRLDGEYGLATRGYIICPDIVPRFPDFGEVRPDEHVGLLVPDLLEGEVVDNQGWFATTSDEGLTASLAPAGLVAIVVAVDELDGDLEEPELVLELVLDDMLGSLEDERLTGVMGADGFEGMIDEDGVSAVVEDDVPHC